jgi:hypothetical protein
MMEESSDRGVRFVEEDAAAVAVAAVDEERDEVDDENEYEERVGELLLDFSVEYELADETDSGERRRSEFS